MTLLVLDKRLCSKVVGKCVNVGDRGSGCNQDMVLQYPCDALKLPPCSISKSNESCNFLADNQSHYSHFDAQLPTMETNFALPLNGFLQLGNPIFGAGISTAEPLSLFEMTQSSHQLLNHALPGRCLGRLTGEMESGGARAHRETKQAKPHRHGGHLATMSESRDADPNVDLGNSFVRLRSAANQSRSSENTLPRKGEYAAAPGPVTPECFTLLRGAGGAVLVAAN